MKRENLVKYRLVKRNIAFKLFTMIVLFLFLMGCINFNNQNDKKQNMDITIKNNERLNVSILLKVINSENIEIFNKNINLSPLEYFVIHNLTEIKGKYEITVIYDGIQHKNDEIFVGDEYSAVKIYINDDYVKISQIVK
jgi:translation initiation factor IF-2